MRLRVAFPNGLWLWVSPSVAPHIEPCGEPSVAGNIGGCWSHLSLILLRVKHGYEEAWCCLGLDCKETSRRAAAPGVAVTRQQRASVPSVILYYPQAACVLIDEVSARLSPQRLFQVWLGYKARSCLEEKGKGP